MPTDLLAAHKELDAAVEAAYDVDFNGDEEKIVAHLFKLYAEKQVSYSRFAGFLFGKMQAFHSVFLQATAFA